MRIRDVLKRFENQKFNGVTIKHVETEYRIDRRSIDVIVFKDDGNPLMIIETKKKRESEHGLRIERISDPSSPSVVGQAVAYVAIFKRNGVYVPFVATVNEERIALLIVPENIEKLVDWNAIDKRVYDKVIKNYYDFYEKYRLRFERHFRFREDYFAKLLNDLTALYTRIRRVEDVRQEFHWDVIEHFRNFIDTLYPYVEDAIAPNGRYREDIAKILRDYKDKTGYEPKNPEHFAREMSYVLLNKIIFYKVLERYYDLPKLRPLFREGLVKTSSEYLKKLNEYFDKAMKLTDDFETIFRTNIYDYIDIVESEEILRAFDELIDLIDHLKIEKLGDVIGFIYEELIPEEERHALGQFYTPKPIAELIVRWSVRSPDDKILDPGCGSGTFLVEAYKRLAELKLRRPFNEIRHVPEDVHRQILRQLYGVDINEFPTHLTTMNLAMKNVRAPSEVMNIFSRDYFTILPNQKILAPYKVKTPYGEKPVEMVFRDFDAIVGNPPYTRWTEILRNTQSRILEILGDVISKYVLTPQIARGVEPGIYIYWIMHSTGFLKEGGRLGMIISDSWLQTDYGMSFFKFLLDNYKVHAVIDISARVFPVPLIGACIILLEKASNAEERNSNRTVFMYLDLTRGSMDVDEVLKLIEEAGTNWVTGQPLLKEFPSGAKALIKTYTQGELSRCEGKVINLIFGASDILNYLRQSQSVVELSKYFEPSRGNTSWSVWAIRHGKRPDVGGEEFFYLTKDKARDQGIPQEYLYPLVSSSRYLRYFTYTKEDWEELRKRGVECYLFLAHKPRSELPETVRKYIQQGEGPEARIRLRRRPGAPEGRPVSESQASQTRREHKELFFDWYDLGGVVEASIYVARGAQYWMRFVLAKFQSALDDRILALIPRQGVQFDEIELKALLAYLNSSFTQLQAEVMGRSTGGGMIELDVRPLSALLILDVKQLSRNEVERLAQLFDRLESEARRLGGADEVENVFGSELATELTGRNDIKKNVNGLFNTVIKEIDYEIARILGLENLVENIRTLVLDMTKRRLSRAKEAKREAIKGSEELIKIEKPKTKRSRDDEGANISLDRFIKKAQQ
jgi:type I restriction-modification system DNA methylase subunit